MIALAYEAYTVRRLWPGPAAESVLTDTHALIAKSYAFVLDHIFRMYALAAQPDPGEGIDLLAGSIRDGCSQLNAETASLTQRMNRLQVVEKTFRHAGVPGVLQHSPLLRGIFRV